MKKRIRILSLLGSPYLYGSEKANIDVLSSLLDKYQHVDIIVLTDISQGDMHIHPYLKSLHINFIPVHYHYRFLKNMSIVEWALKFSKIILGCISLFRIIYLYNPTHIYFSKPEYFLNFLPILYVLKRTFIFRVGDSPVVHNIVYRLLWDIIVKKSSKIICVSRFIEKQVLSTGVAKSKTEVIYSRPHKNVDVELNTMKPHTNGMFTVFFAGQIAKHKGIDLLVVAGLNLCKKYRNINFIFAGKLDREDNYTQELIDKTANSAFSEQIKFLDFVTNTDEFFQISDLHVCPSVYEEPLANVLIDAKKHGIPSIIFAVGGLTEIISHNVNGFICNDKTVTALENAIEYFLLNPDICKIMGMNALESLAELQIDFFSERWLNVFEDSL